ncbi:MAG: DUF6508 domain-containing protein [Candidatus Bipolaricaulota bacterium]
MCTTTNLDPRSPDLREHMECLAQFEATFEDPTFRFGTWIPARPMPHQGLVGPEFVLSDGAEAFVDALRAIGWVTPAFDAAAWSRTPEAQALVGDEEALARATPEQLARLVAALVLRDSHDMGTLADAFESGLLLRIVRRAATLRNAPA